MYAALYTCVDLSALGTVALHPLPTPCQRTASSLLITWTPKLQFTGRKNKTKQRKDAVKSFFSTSYIAAFLPSSLPVCLDVAQHRRIQWRSNIACSLFCPVNLKWLLWWRWEEKGRGLTANQAGETLGPLTELILGLYFSTKKEKNHWQKKRCFPSFWHFQNFGVLNKLQEGPPEGSGGVREPLKTCFRTGLLRGRSVSQPIRSRPHSGGRTGTCCFRRRKSRHTRQVRFLNSLQNTAATCSHDSAGF